ncbi:MAG: hypothetical protein ACD_80C00079G0009 [uncultured bacterium (gcode 4)]|uniref:Uncharacterized protein n=1 Tax=uncultured bacterium (gcode 4) TaxID=1234023 RepID=K1XJI7_9BACT|nr:MAG: hypothetical protein ACD_80C00079G0009 [uncultured bacterium (gcode 4)]
MNSKNLKKTYVQTYEKFFFENQTVISAPFVLNRSGDILNNYSGVGIKQKIPLRMYIGYTRSATKWISVDKIYHLDMNEYQFIESNAVEYAPYFADINKELEKKYAKSLWEDEGIQINILSELPRGVGLWFGSILALLLSVVVNRIYWDMDISGLESLKTKNIDEVISDSWNSFYKILVDALYFDKFIYGMMSSGTKIASFFDGYYPTVSFSEDGDKSLLPETEMVNRCYGFKLNHLFKWLRENPYLPIDYWIIYSGKPVLLEQIGGNNYKTNQNSTKTIKSEFKKLFGDNFSNLHQTRIPRFYKYFISPETDEFDMTYGKLMGAISIKILYHMSKIYAESYEETHMLQFLDSMRKMRQGDCVTRNSSTNFLKFIKAFLENFQGQEQYLSLSPNDSTIMGWSLIFAMPLEWFRKMIVDAADKTNMEFMWSKLIYVNRIDGVEHEGLKFEQDLGKGIYSEFLDSSSCILKMADGKIQVGNCENSIKSHKKWILLDMINNKIYINGRKLTSEDLHSQTGTVDILKVLIENIGKDISNKALPVSSYSKNKNDMLGKIVLPLIELIEKETGKKLPLICKWSIHEFYLKLNPSDVEMAVIDKLQK